MKRKVQHLSQLICHRVFSTSCFVGLGVTDLRDVRHYAQRVVVRLCFQHHHALVHMPLTGGGIQMHWSQVSLNICLSLTPALENLCNRAQLWKCRRSFVKSHGVLALSLTYLLVSDHTSGQGCRVTSSNRPLCFCLFPNMMEAANTRLNFVVQRCGEGFLD